jgi:hypothetical protein
MFWFASWASLGLAVLLLAGHLLAPGLTPEAATRLAQDPPPFIWLVPGLLHPDAAGALTGLSLSVSLLMATIGAAGLVVVKRAEDEVLIRGVARAFALGTSGLLALSIADSFGVQTFVISIVALCFAMAAVPQE